MRWYEVFMSTVFTAVVCVTSEQIKKTVNLNFM